MSIHQTRLFHVSFNLSRPYITADIIYAVYDTQIIVILYLSNPWNEDNAIWAEVAFSRITMQREHKHQDNTRVSA